MTELIMTIDVCPALKQNEPDKEQDLLIRELSSLFKIAFKVNWVLNEQMRTYCLRNNSSMLVEVLNYGSEGFSVENAAVTGRSLSLSASNYVTFFGRRPPENMYEFISTEMLNNIKQKFNF